MGGRELLGVPGLLSHGWHGGAGPRVSHGLQHWRDPRSTVQLEPQPLSLILGPGQGPFS